MIKSCRTLIAALGLLISVDQAQADGLVQRPGLWAQNYTDRAADPAIRFGQMPNGMRFAIMHNATPAGHMPLRLEIGSGALSEKPSEQGLAHFLEHMAFRGSTNMADGEMMRTLARYGLSFGADLNASTYQLATVYKFDFPRSADADIDIGLMLFREIASNLTIDPAAVDIERGVVLSEERLRDKADFRALKALYDDWLPGQLATRRWPIGKTDILQHATADQLRGFYRREYRPDNAVLVAVGDFDPTVMQNMIETRFSDWSASPAPARPEYGKPTPRGPGAALFTEAAAPTMENIAFVRPYDDSADTDARATRSIERSLAIRILDNRLTALAQAPDAPITGGNVSFGNVSRSANVTEIAVNASPERWQEAMRAMLGAERSLAQSGPTRAELDRVIAQHRAVYSAALGQAGNRQSASLAETIVMNALNDIVTRSPAQNLAEFAAVATTTDVAAVGAAFRDLVGGSGPIAFLSTPHPPAGGLDEVRRALETAMSDPVIAEAESAAVDWPYADFGAPGTVTERQELADLGLTVVHFANGASLTVRPMPERKGRVAVSVAFGSGRLGLPPALSHAYWLLGRGTFIDGGTGKLSADEVRRASERSSSPLQFVMNDLNFALKVQTTPTHLDFALQLCTAYLTDPGFRAQSVTRAKTQMQAGLPFVEGSEEKVLARAEARALHGGDPRWSTIPTAADIAATRPDDLRTLLEPELRAGPPQIVVVGDIDVASAIASVGRTLGTLPAIAPAPTPLGVPVHFPGPGT
ncbi:MAG: insulinase family protein, partial [Janthinobacterium lividum]